MVDATAEDVGEWLAAKAEEQRGDPDVYEALLAIAAVRDPRATLIALGRLAADRAAGPHGAADQLEVMRHG
jgi:hypothetical protein